ncbi:MAG: methyltransferase domain-containing protein [Patescibacteria group bacterium]|nr:methyltransferase domain-containing protein [Patescibacteria group bacterium]
MALRQSPLHGTVLDLGGSRKAGYHELLRAVGKFDVVNLDPGAEPDYRFDLEQAFPLADESYDGVLCLNILEHIYNYRAFLSECHRVLRKDGALVIAAPFLVQVHPSPHDYFRYTEEALRKMLTEAGFRDISIEPIGTGVGLALAQLFYNALKFGFLRTLAEWKGRILDAIISAIKKESFLSGKYYPLGYFITVRKQSITRVS